MNLILKQKSKEDEQVSFVPVWTPEHYFGGSYSRQESAQAALLPSSLLRFCSRPRCRRFPDFVLKVTSKDGELIIEEVKN